MRYIGWPDFIKKKNFDHSVYCMQGALSIEVYGHRSSGFAPDGQSTEWNREQQAAKARSLADR